ncbi:zinc-dependent alcohol dehydrogenase [Streptomyces sp. YIM S03343]
MQAVRYDGPGKVGLVEIPTPKPGPGEVLVKISMCGICGTDVHAYKEEGVLFPGTVLGHEAVGRVAELGPGVTGLTTGDRVVIGAPGLCPEGCPPCRAGRSTLCEHGFERTPGIGPGTQGAYAEYVLARHPDHQLVKVPDAVTDEAAVLFDIFSTAWHGLRGSQFQAGMDVAVVGVGAIGLSMVQLLKVAGAGSITAVNRSLLKRETALRLGADLALSPAEEADLAARYRDAHGGRSADIVYECAGSAAAVGEALRLVRPGGELMILGTTPEPLSTINPIQIQLFEIDVRGSFAYTEDEIRTVLSFMERGLLVTEGLVQKTVPLDGVPDALEELAHDNRPVRYVVVP